MRAATRRCGSWCKAIRRAGLDPAKVCPQRPSRSPEQVDAALIAWSRKHGPLNPKKLLETDSPLYAAARRRHHGVARAAKALGLEFKPSSAVATWTKASIRKAIHELHAKGAMLTVLTARRHYPGLTGAADKLYGSWRRMLGACGLGKHLVRRACTDAQLGAKFLAWAERHGGVVVPRDMVASDPGLLSVLRRRYGTLEKAARRFKVPYRPLRRSDERG